MKQLNNKKETKESGSLIKKPQGTSFEKMAVLVMSSKTASTNTGAKLDLSTREGTSKGVEAGREWRYPKSVVVGSASAREWPSFKVMTHRRLGMRRSCLPTEKSTAVTANQ